jgi:hypothetical protein
MARDVVHGDILMSQCVPNVYLRMTMLGVTIVLVHHPAALITPCLTQQLD